MAWVTKLTEIVDRNNGLELDQEAVTEFRLQKEEYLEGVASDLRTVALREKRCVEAVSETAKSLRDVHAQNVGKKVMLWSSACNVVYVRRGFGLMFRFVYCVVSIG